MELLLVDLMKDKYCKAAIFTGATLNAGLGSILYFLWEARGADSLFTCLGLECFIYGDKRH